MHRALAGDLDKLFSERRIDAARDADHALAAKLVEIAGKCPVHRTLEGGAAVVTKVADSR